MSQGVWYTMLTLQHKNANKQLQIRTLSQMKAKIDRWRQWKNVCLKGLFESFCSLQKYEITSYLDN